MHVDCAVSVVLEVFCCISGLLQNMAPGNDSSTDAMLSRALVTFSSANVSILFQNRPAAGGSDGHRAAYASAQRQCVSQILSGSPKGFELQTSGSVAAPVAQTLILQRELVAQLPILLVASHTNSATHDEGSDREQCTQAPIEMRVPCSVWGLVSLLLILDGCIGVEKMLHATHNGEPAAAELPLETMEVRHMCSARIRESSSASVARCLRRCR